MIYSIPSISPLQVNVFLPTIPPGLGAFLILFGLELMLISVLREGISQMDANSKKIFGAGIQQADIILITAGFGILLLTIGSLQRYNLVIPYIGLLFFLGNTITGAAHVRLWKKIEYFLRKRQYSGNLKRTIVYGLLTMFVLVVCISLTVNTLFSAPFDFPYEFNIALIWTIVVLLLSILGLSRRVLPLRDQLGSLFVYGFIIAISGTQIFDLVLPLEIAFLFIGSLGYSAGFWIAVFFWLRK